MQYKWLFVFSIIVLVASTIYITLRVLKWWKSYLGRQRFRSGNKAEKRALKFLQKNGYEILASQYKLEHNFKIDNEPICIELKVDFLVQKKNLKYLAEVKSGLSAPNIRNKDTRRQLLEYHQLNPFEGGLLLIDMQEKRIRKVEF